MRLTKSYISRYARQTVGGLSDTSKMPCYSWSISSKHCKRGAKLAEKKNSVCAKCYASRGNYLWPNTVNAMQRRLDSYLKDNVRWRWDFLHILRSLSDLGETHFRWFDSGDLQSKTMLADILWVTERVPSMQFWLPTKETDFVYSYLKGGGTIPDNTVVRVSAPLIGSSNGISKSLTNLSSRVAHSYVSVVKPDTQQCPASQQNHKCDQCRACWDTGSVSYKEI